MACAGVFRLRTDGGLRTARDIVMAALLQGADEFAFGTSVLVALGAATWRASVIWNTCPTGIGDTTARVACEVSAASQNTWCASSMNLRVEVRQLLATLGLPSLAAWRRDARICWNRFAGTRNLDSEACTACSRQNCSSETGGPIRWGGRAERSCPRGASADRMMRGFSSALEAFKKAGNAFYRIETARVERRSDTGRATRGSAGAFPVRSTLPRQART